jgi:hypothetical protein
MRTLLVQQGGYTKFPCFLCEWESRAREKHWTVTDWPQRKSFVPGTKRVIKPTLTDQQKVLLPLLHIKLGIMKQSVKALNRSGPCHWYLTQRFQLLSEEKVKEGVFDSPQIWQLIRGSTFTNSIRDLDLQPWNLSRSYHQISSKL